MFAMIANTTFPNNVSGWRAFQAVAPTLSRDDLIAILVWNDRNGCYTDEQCAVEDMDPLTHADAVVLLQSVATF